MANSTNSENSDYSNKKYSLKRLASTLSVMDPGENGFGNSLMSKPYFILALEDLKNLP